MSSFNIFFLVSGIRDAFHPHSVLQLIPVGVGEVKIQGLESSLYLAMNSKGSNFCNVPLRLPKYQKRIRRKNLQGRLYAEDDESNDATIFLETSNGYYLNYLSKKYAHLGWYIGLTKEGRAKSGRKTWYPWGQKAIQFVARKAYDEPHPLRYHPTSTTYYNIVFAKGGQLIALSITNLLMCG